MSGCSSDVVECVSMFDVFVDVSRVYLVTGAAGFSVVAVAGLAWQGLVRLRKGRS